MKVCEVFFIFSLKDFFLEFCQKVYILFLIFKFQGSKSKKPLAPNIDGNLFTSVG